MNNYLANVSMEMRKCIRACIHPRRQLRGMGEGFIPGITPEIPVGKLGGEWRSVNLSGYPYANMPLVPTGRSLGFRGMNGVMDDVWDAVYAKLPTDLWEAIKGIFSGEYEAQLTDARQQMRQNQADLRSLKSSIDSMPEGYEKEAALADYNEAYQKQLEYENNIIQSIAWYNNGVYQLKSHEAYRTIEQYFSSVGLRNPQMLGMGEVATATIIITVAAALVALALALPSILREVRVGVLTLMADGPNLKTMIDAVATGSDMAPSAMQPIADVGKYAVIAAAIFFGYKMLQDSGGLKSLVGSFRGGSK